MGDSPQLDYVDKSQDDSTVVNQSFSKTLAVFNILVQFVRVIRCATSIRKETPSKISIKEPHRCVPSASLLLKEVSCLIFVIYGGIYTLRSWQSSAKMLDGYCNLTSCTTL